ncbi:uncharacterized membrane protein HdeD (DUF308 family) [Pedobacter sp. UYP30]|uniref:hypothetical protein n=1 Tax=Pedobacter sp. UYP30 TaxID=1756400 RepID=UPI00339A42B1
MLTNKKYKSDKILRPFLILLVGVIFFVNYFSDKKSVVIVLLVSWLTIIFGVMIYRFIREKDKENAAYSSVALVFSYLLILLSIIYLQGWL